MNNTNGRIAEQSKEKMVQALLHIMEQYDYREITVTQIAQEARMSRKTFYRLFSGKDEILHRFFEGLFQEFLTGVKEKKIRHYWDAVQEFFDFWEERRALLLLLQKNGLLGQVMEQSYQYDRQVFELVRSEELALSLAVPLPYMLAYSVGGIHCMLLKWVEEGMEIPSEELIEALKTGFMSRNI